MTLDVFQSIAAPLVEACLHRQSAVARKSGMHAPHDVRMPRGMGRSMQSIVASTLGSAHLDGFAVSDAYFDRIYATDLRYVRDCYKLCGDAHCCNFTRYKSKFMFMGRTQFQELPLLPGELAYLERHGLLKQFGDFEVRRTDFPLAQGIIRYEAIVSKRPGCACDNATRPTICRLYPLYPQYDAAGALVGMETVGIYEELERIGGMAPACQITTVPVTEMAAFIAFADHIASSSAAAFHMEAFRLAKHAAAATVARVVAASGSSPFRAFELSMLRSTLFDTRALRSQLEALATEYEALGRTDFLLPYPEADDMLVQGVDAAAL